MNIKISGLRVVLRDVIKNDDGSYSGFFKEIGGERSIEIDFGNPASFTNFVCVFRKGIKADSIFRKNISIYERKWRDFMSSWYGTDNFLEEWLKELKDEKVL